MRFCPKCSSLMILVKNGKQYYLVCTRCDYKEAEDDIIYRYRYRLKGKGKKHINTGKPISIEKHYPDLELLEDIREETCEIRDMILLKVIGCEW